MFMCVFVCVCVCVYVCAGAGACACVLRYVLASLHEYALQVCDMHVRK